MSSKEEFENAIADWMDGDRQSSQGTMTIRQHNRLEDRVWIVGKKILETDSGVDLLISELESSDEVVRAFAAAILYKYKNIMIGVSMLLEMSKEVPLKEQTRERMLANNIAYRFTMHYDQSK